MTRSGAGASKLPRCKLFNELQFLKDGVSNRNTDSNVCFDETIFSNSEASFLGPLTSPNEVREDSERSYKIKSSKKKTSTPASKPMRDIEDRLVTALENKPQQKEEYDADVMFVKSLVPILKKLPDKKNRMAKIELQQVLFWVQDCLDDDYALLKQFANVKLIYILIN